MNRKTLEVKVLSNLPDGHFLESMAKVEFPLPDGRDLVQGPFTYNSDGLSTVHNCDFLKDPLFNDSYRFGMKTGHGLGELHIEWRVYVACWAAHHAKKLKGDFVECGVNTGIYSRAVMHYIGFEKMKGRKFYLLDTFRGVPEGQWTEEEKSRGLPRMNRHYRNSYAKAVRVFRPFKNAVLVQGVIPDTLPRVKSKRICYLSIDMNCALPEVKALEYFWPRLVSGGAILLDDYGFANHARQKKALDGFARSRNAMILSLPTGQGLMIKS